MSDELLEDWIRRVGLVFDAEADRELVGRVVLAKCRGDAFVQLRLQALDRPYYRDMRCLFPKLR